MVKNWLVFFLLSIPFWIYSEEPIIVRLSTESKLLPLYLSKIQGKSDLDHSYLNELNKTLSFDLNYNGMTKIVDCNNEREKRSNIPFDAIDDLEAWKKDHVYYIVKTKLQDRKLTLRAISVNNRYAQNTEEVTLTGDITKDRKTIHRLADTIHRILFGNEGIANTKILYTLRKRPNGTSDATKFTSEVWECDYNGLNPRQITCDNCLCLSPIYIPPKTPQAGCAAFFFVSYKTGQPKIYVASLKDGQSRRFTYLPGNQLMPTVSKQRDQLAFISDVTTNSDLFVHSMATDTTPINKPRQIFAMRHAAQASPSFSPDGKQVAFVSDKDGTPRIYTMEIPPEGSFIKNPKATVITKKNRENSAPAWSPDGTKIAYCASTDKNRQIWIVDLITGVERQLTQGPGNKENPSWAPDSLHLVFNSASENSSELYLVNLNQPEAIKISSGPGEKRFPCWEPR